MRRVVLQVLLSPEFQDEASYFTRYAWPVEFVVKAVKETGWAGFSVDNALSPMLAMGQQLFEPPDVNGWETGAGRRLRFRPPMCCRWEPMPAAPASGCTRGWRA